MAGTGEGKEALSKEARGSQQLDELRAAPTQRLSKALSSFEQNLGGRDALIHVLASSTPTSAEEAFLIRLADPTNDDKGLSRILVESGMTVTRFFSFLKEARGAKAIMDSLGEVWEGLPMVTSDLMQRSIPRAVTCHGCNGSKIQEVGGVQERCALCTGAGVILHEPDLEHQRLVFDLAGMLKKTPMIQKTVDARSLRITGGVHTGDEVNHHHLDSRFTENFLAASDQVLYGRKIAEVVEAEVTEVAETPESLVAETASPEEL